MTLQRAAFFLLFYADLCFAQPTIKLIAGAMLVLPLAMEVRQSMLSSARSATSLWIPRAIFIYGRDRLPDPQSEHGRHHQQRDGHHRPTEGNRRTGGLATDSAGNLYIGDTQSYMVRKVDTSGVMTTIAGNGTAGISGNNGSGSQATSVAICSPSGL